MSETPLWEQLDAKIKQLKLIKIPSHYSNTVAPSLRTGLKQIPSFAKKTSAYMQIANGCTKA